MLIIVFIAIPVCTYIILRRICFYTYVYILLILIIKMITLESSIYKLKFTCMTYREFI